MAQASGSRILTNPRGAPDDASPHRVAPVQADLAREQLAKLRARIEHGAAACPMSLAPLQLVSAHPWNRVVFTTYALSLSFFEAVILDALVRGGTSRALILADVQGVRGSLGELGAQRVGRDYEVEPVSVSTGVFHPKVSVFSSPDECHVLVGSGNLTFGGWGGNCEIVEHLHPSFAADAITDLAGFFERLADTDRVRHVATGDCLRVSADLRKAVQERPRTGEVRVLHSLDAAIMDQLVELVRDLGGAQRLVAVAPFWDDGSAIDKLCAAIGLDHVFVHAHGSGCVTRPGARHWPTARRVTVHGIRLEMLEPPESRKLHAKAFEIICKRGRVIVSGSPNGSLAALGPGANVEVCVARIQRRRIAGWTFIRGAVPPASPLAGDDDKQPEDRSSGVLRAHLEADELVGTVLTPGMTSPVTVHHLDTIGAALLGATSLRADGSFQLGAPRFEERSWRGGRLVVRVTDRAGRTADGFVSLAGFSDIARRAGVIAPRLFSLLAGTETPADVAAIMAWFHEDPQRLLDATPATPRAGGDAPQNQLEDELIPVASLSDLYGQALELVGAAHASQPRGWSRFVEQLLAALRAPRGPFTAAGSGRTGEDEDDDDDERKAPQQVAGDDAVAARAFGVFEKLFAVLTDDGADARRALAAFDLTQYVCDRLRPSPADASRWLRRLMKVLPGTGVPDDRRDDVAAAALVLLGMDPRREPCRWARGCLRRLGVDLAASPPSDEGAHGFRSVVPQRATVEELWQSIASVRTYAEQVRALERALRKQCPSAGYPDLPDVARDEWPVLQEALTSRSALRKILVGKRGAEACPMCHIKLPEGEVQKLRSPGIATARNCCGRVILGKDG